MEIKFNNKLHKYPKIRMGLQLLNINWVSFTLVLLKIIKNKGMGLLDGLMEQLIKENLKMMSRMEKVNLYIRMVINIKVIGYKIKQMELENIQEQQEVIMKEVGEGTSPKGMEYKIGGTVIFIKVNLKMG